MSKRSLRDRFLTPPVARAIMSPLGMVAFGAVPAGSILVRLPVVAALGVGAVAWAGNVARSVPRNPKSDRVEPFVLADPWRSYVVGAKESKARFDRVVADMSAGPLRDRLADLAARLDDGIAESWQIAKRGNEIANALTLLDTVRAETELAELRASITARPQAQQTPTSSESRTMEALVAQVDSALSAAGHRGRRPRSPATARRPLRRTGRSRAVEVSVGAGDSTLLGDDVDGLVTELESLRVALDETNRPRPRPSERPLRCRLPRTIRQLTVSSLLHSNLVVATGTALSRITGCCACSCSPT